MAQVFRTFRLFAVVAFVAAGLATVGCTKRGKDIEVQTASGEKITLPVAETLRINIVSEPPSLDWHKSTDTTSSHITDNTMEGLTQYDLADKELGLKPALAVKWESSNQAKTWKFTLRSDVKWSDGQAFTSQHVVDGFKRLLAKETTSEYSYFLYGVKNAKAFNEGKVPFDQVGVKATSPTEVVVELDKSMSYFPYLLTHHSTYPIRLDIVEKFGDKWTEPGNVVTLGPFNLKVWQHDKMIVLERNESYYEEKPAIKYIAAYMLQEQSTAINLFDSGQLDTVYALPSIELKKQSQRKEYRRTGILQLYYYGMNVTKPPMDKPLVRKAIAAAIDRQEIVKMLDGGQIPMTSWVPMGMFGYEPTRGTNFDAVKAKELLKQAGYEDPTKFPKIEIKFNTNEDHQRIAENIQAQLKRNLGINVELKNEEWKVFLNTLNTDPPHLFRFGWLADYPDPDNFLNVITGYSENNRTRWKNAKYDDLVNRGAGATEKEVRRKIYDEAQKILVEDEVPVVPLMTSVSHSLVSDRVEGYQSNAMNKHSYKSVRLK